MFPSLPLKGRTDDVLLKYISQDEYDIIASYLNTWQKSGQEWNQFRQKIDGKILAQMSKAWRECRRLGLFGPRTSWHDGKLRIGFLTVMQVESRFDKHTHYQRPKPEPCDYCERDCDRKDDKGNFYEKTDPCWKGRDY